MMEPVKFGVVGVGGYAKSYHNSLAVLRNEGSAQLVALAENNQSAYPLEMKELRERGVRIYDDYFKMLHAEKGNLDFMALPVGIHLHAPMSIEAMNAGLNVICEKPVAATVQEVDAMIAVKKRTGAIVIVGYQEIFSPSIRALKERIMDGRLGAVKIAKTMGRWSRPDSYYQRNNWAGKLRLGEHWVLDGIAMNAMAHHVNNMLFLASPRAISTALPVEMTAELYRAHPIESYDSVTFRAKTDSGSTVFFAATHAPESECGPDLQLECVNGTATRSFVNGESVIKYKNGTSEQLDNHQIDDRTEVFRNAVACVLENHSPLSTLEMARAHTICMNGMHESCPEIVTIPPEEINISDLFDKQGKPTGDRSTTVRHIDRLLDRAFDQIKLLSELGVSWAKKSRKVPLEGYSKFPGGR
ncbi:Gfo/Idh/MocA family oxidoreductase [candidate division KSB1 bacterium]|nr:Gfo/Idh/MocA family oxidoreductase [candidate division KSB1 bacterium]